MYSLIWTVYKKTHINNSISLEGYMEHMNQCITNCPPAFKTVNCTCEECTGDCDEGMVVVIMYKQYNNVVFVHFWFCTYIELKITMFK